MIKVKEHSKESLLKKKLKEIEKMLLQTQKELERETAYNQHLESIIEKNEATKKSKIITIKSATKIEFVNADDIVCCNADEAYTDVQLINGKTITVAKPLSTFDSLLAENTFFRISKSHLINTSYIVTFFKDRNQILLKGDILLDVARRRRVAFMKTLK